MATKWTCKNKLSPPKRVYKTMPQTLHLGIETMFWYCLRTRTHVALPPPKDHPLMFTSDQKLTIAILLKWVDDMHAPDYASEAINKWGRAARDDNNHSLYGLSRSKQHVDFLVHK
jgi:hypothetical protein